MPFSNRVAFLDTSLISVGNMRHGVSETSQGKIWLNELLIRSEFDPARYMDDTNHMQTVSFMNSLHHCAGKVQFIH